MSNDKFDITELSQLSGISVRNIRYYIQLGIINRPIGEKRSAYYTQDHLESILQIRKWQEAGLSLERIKELLTEEDNSIPIPKRKVGSISVVSTIHIAEGIDLIVDPELANMKTEKIRELSHRIIEFIETNKPSK